MATTRTEERPGRDVTINLRANSKQRALIDRAAETLGKNRSDLCWKWPAGSGDGAPGPSVLPARREDLQAVHGGAGQAAGRERPLRRLLATKAPWE